MKAASEYWSIDKLNLWDRNPRSIKTERFEELKNRLKRQGQIKPLLVAKEDRVVIGGNMRLRAMRELGWTEVWVSLVSAPDDKTKFDLALTDNEEFGYYEQEQVAELALELGLSPLELQSYALQLGQPTTLDLVVDELGPEITEEDDEVPEVDEQNPPVSELGDVYQLGDHRLMCGSATEAAHIEKLMAGDRAEMVWTDPPYGVAVGDKNKMLNTIGPSNRVEQNLLNDTLDEPELKEMLREAFSIAAQHCTAGAAWYVAAPPGPLHVLFGEALKELGIWRQTIQWVKNNATFSPLGVSYHWRAEPIFYGWLPNGAKRFYGGRKQTTVWEIDRPLKSADHPTMKPVELVARSIHHSSRQGEVVLDMFTGSGSTLIAADKTGRIFRGTELDPKYCDVVRKRYWKHKTGDEHGWETGTPSVEVGHAVAA